jgi:hypothetical protein
MNTPLSDAPNVGTPGLYRVQAVAKQFGLTPRQFIRGCRSGHIPCRLVQVGEKTFMVNAGDVLAMAEGLKFSPEIFDSEPSDRPLAGLPVLENLF